MKNVPFSFPNAGGKGIKEAMEKRSILFSPPDMSEMEVNEVADTIRSGWITTGAIDIIGTYISCCYGISDGYKWANES